MFSSREESETQSPENPRFQESASATTELLIRAPEESESPRRQISSGKAFGCEVEFRSARIDCQHNTVARAGREQPDLPIRRLETTRPRSHGARAVGLAKSTQIPGISVSGKQAKQPWV